MAWLPSAADVHGIIPQRVPGGFTASSIPTTTAVEATAVNVQAEVQAYIGQDTVVEAEDETLGLFTVATGTAARTERALYPEQSVEDDSTYAELWADYRQLAAQFYYAVHGEWPTHLIDEIPDADEGGGPALLPQGHFPTHDWVGHRGW